jgi:hypothetical protein
MTMTPSDVKQKLIEILKEIQLDSGLPCPPLNGLTKPTVDIPKFDSKVWPVATTILATELNASIPDDVNIFVDEVTKVPRTIDEIAGFVCRLVEKKKAAA